MKVTRRFTKSNEDVFSSVQYEIRTSRISNPDGSIVFEMNDAEIPKSWSQLATDIMVSKYFRKAGVPQLDANGKVRTDDHGKPILGPEKSVKQVIHRLAGCWRHWGETHNYFDTTEDAQAFYDELAYMMLNQMCAPNSPQWFNTGLNWAYGISGPAQGHFYCDPVTGELQKGKDAYTHPQPHACQPFRAPVSTPNGPVPIGKIVKENLIGLEVFDGTYEGNGIARVTAVKENGEQQVFRVIMDGGAIIEATGDHLVYVLTQDAMTGRWVRIDSLERGMDLLQSVRDRMAERAMASSPLAATLGPEAVAAVTAGEGTEIRRLQPAKIRRIETIGMHTVYDIQTTSGQYLSNNIVVHNCFIQSVSDDLVNAGGIMDLWTREARLFKYGSGTGSNFSRVRGENESLSGGGKSSGLMSFLKIGDRAAGAIKSGGTTRRAAKMVCLDLDHPDIEQFVNWKVREELKVACLAEGIKHIPGDQQELAKKLGLKLDYDFNGEAYYTVSGQNSNNSVRIPNAFFKAVEEDGDWKLINRVNGKVAKTVKARALWDEIAFAAWRCADPGVQFDSTINDWHTCPKSGRINASNPCVTGDTRVLTPGGIWRRIDQMIHLPARVVTNLHSQEIHVTDGAFPTGTRDIFELRTAGGYTLKLTGNHKIWTRHRGWVPASELTTADEVRLPNQPAAVNEIGEPQDAKFFQLVGMFLSDTNNNPNAIRLDHCLAGTEVAEDFSAYIAHTWSEQPDEFASRVAHEIATLSAGESSEEESGHILTAPVTHRRLISRINAFVRTELGRRRLSDEAFTAGLPAQKHMIRGLFTTDGHVTSGGLELHNRSLSLLKDVQLILLGFGVQSSILKTNDGGAVVSGEMFDRQVFTTPLGGDDLGTRNGSGSRSDAIPRHGLRIESGSLRSFNTHIGLIPGRKADELDFLIGQGAFEASIGNYDHFADLVPMGREQVFDLTEPKTHSFIAGGITVHNCSEYMFLDDTACNLASLNVLTFYDADTRTFDIEAFKHGVRLWTIVLEISVLMASFPSEEIATLSYKFRTLGLGYANLGAMLMQSGIAYDSDKGRAICAAISAVLTGESYATSADMAAQMGAFPGFAENETDMLRVIRNHRRAAYGKEMKGSYESLDIKPVEIDASQFSETDPLASRLLLASARECWDRALALGEKHGYRNAQTTVIAPTGCLVAGSLINTDRGLVRLNRLGDVNGPRWQDASFSVLTDQGERQATQFFVNGAEVTRKIRTASGYFIQGTTKHRIKVVDELTGQWEWKRFSDIAPGDVVPLSLGKMVGDPRAVPLPPLGEIYWTGDYTTRVPRTMTPELAEFVGYFMGDGSLHAKGIRLCVAQTDTDVVARLTQLTKSLFNLDVHLTQKDGYVELAVHSVALVMWWEACGFTKLMPAPEHSGKGYLPRIPDALLATNDAVVYGAFLRGLYEADGSVLAGMPTWSTAQGDFADDVRTLLLTLGLPTSTKHDVSGWGQGVLHVLRLRNSSYAGAFARLVGFMSVRKRALLREQPTHEQAARYDYVYVPAETVDELVPAGAPLYNAVQLSRKRNRAITRRSAEMLFEQTADVRIGHALEFFYDTVESNEDGGEQLTYDISVPENVTYVANGFVSHNTIGLLMDCDTTGVEPDFALVKFKKLSGGGYFKIANQSVRPALVNLGYTPEQIHDILRYCLGSMSLHDTPHINWLTLKEKGLTQQELQKIEESLPGQFEISFAFSGWSLGADTMTRLGIAESEWQAKDFSLLKRLGFTRKQIDAANDVICGRGTIEGAPHLREAHYSVFDCANKCGKHGTRYIHPDGHIRMMAAAQPFITGAISKTINLPNEATLEEIKQSYRLSWELGLKSNALYRDGSKLSQPLNVKSDKDVDELEEDDANTESAVEEIGALAASGLVASATSSTLTSDNLEPTHVKVIEKIIERIVERPLRRRLPDTRHAITHKFDVAGHEGYITAGLYTDGQPGEVFITMAKEGSTIGGLMDSIATLVSVSLQYGVPVESLVRKFEHVRFEPSGMTRNPEIPMAKSLVDYIFRWLAMEFVPGYRATNAPQRGRKVEVPEEPPFEAEAESDPVITPAAPRIHTNGNGNGHGHTHSTDVLPTNRLGATLLADPLSQQGTEMQADAPACDVCGSITVRSGTCYKCLNCGNSMGCS